MPDEVSTHRPPPPAPAASRELNAQRDRAPEPSYYDISFLKPPVWKWEIASYFFLGGISGGSYLLARLAERFGGGKYRDITRVGDLVAFFSLLPCPPLLIHDLGDPKRFHHMLRIFKPSSPMSLGTWVLTSYSAAATAAVVRDYLRDHGTLAGRNAVEKIANGSLVAITDAAGIPLALLLVGYTGVLLSSTSNPLWSKNPWIGSLFMASGISTAAAATSLAIELTNLHSAARRPASASHDALDKIDSAAHVAEVVSVAGYLKHAGPLAKPLTHGKYRHHFWGAIVGIVAAEALKLLPFRGAAKRKASGIASVIGLLAGFSLRWTFVYSGHASAADPHQARLSTSAPMSSNKKPKLPGAPMDELDVT